MSRSANCPEKKSAVNGKRRLKKYVRKTLWEALAACLAVFAAGCLLWTAISPPTASASALVCFTNISETEMNGSAGIDYTARKVALLRQSVMSTEALEAAAGSSSLSVSELTQYLTVERLGSSDSAIIVLSGLSRRSEAPLILGSLMNTVQKGFDPRDMRVISYCDIERQPGFPFVPVFLSAGIMSGFIYFKILYKLRAKKHAKNAARKRAERSSRRSSDPGADRKPRPEIPRQIPEKRYIETAMLKAVSLGNTVSAAPEGLEKSGYTHAARVLLDSIAAAGGQNRSKAAVIAVCAAHGDADTKPVTGNDDIAGHTAAVSKGLVEIQTPPKPKRDIPPDGTFAAYLSCALVSLGCRVALIECDLTKPVIGKIFRKTGAGGLADMAAGHCTVWEALLPNARKGVDIICDKKPYPAPTAVFSASSFGGLINYLSSQYDVILLHTPKGWDCPEWELIYRYCTGVAAVAEKGRTPDKTCAMGILDAKGRITALAAVADPAVPEAAPTEVPENAKKAGKQSAKKEKIPKRKKPLISPLPGKKNTPSKTAVKEIPEPPREVVRVMLPEIKR